MNFFPPCLNSLFYPVLCPLCGATPKAFSNPFFAVCENDKLVIHTAFKETNYEENYFEKEYVAQYGKSYIDDKPAISARAKWRYERVQHFLKPTTHPRLLEVGSAAGFFLEAMQAQGFQTEGWEVSESMTEYANAHSITTYTHDFFGGAMEHLRQQKPRFDAVALFYVLEHFADQKKAWELLSSLVREGGFLLLSLPSVDGPTFHYAREKWYSTHPQDHAVDYSPASLERIGMRFGFKCKAVFSEGIHPQRFPWGEFPPIAYFYRKMLEKLPISDTIFAILERTHP
ncbi:MAG TPA: class I SAM-dependent methyltransferase [Turneriella sp.]|nr:class I SAM-dependent methyltransferase [Turneriella sp.]